MKKARSEFEHPVNIQGNTVPIAALPYLRSEDNLSIRGLVTYKSRLTDPRHVHQRGIPPFFVIHFLDESEEIRGYVNGAVALETYDRFEEGKTYYISDFCVRFRLSGFFFNLPNNWTIEFMPYTRIDEVCVFMIFERRFNLSEWLIKFSSARRSRVYHNVDLISSQYLI